jgi:hypothetical protein
MDGRYAFVSNYGAQTPGQRRHRLQKALLYVVKGGENV